MRRKAPQPMGTPVLDAWFGPRKEQPTAPEPRRTQFPRCEESIRDLCDAFADRTNWRLDEHTRKVIIAGARDFERAIGNRPDLLLQAMTYMTSKGITFSSPRSCITIARELQASADGHSPQSYIEGEFADFIEH